MPSSLIIAFGAALASSAAVEAGLVLAGGFGAALVGAAAAVGLGSVFSRMAKTDLANDSKSSLSTGRDPVAPWQWIYGETRVGGTITFLAAGESPFGEINGVLHMVITLAGHDVESIGDIYFNDEKVTLDGQGFVISGQWAGQWVIVTKALGNESVQPFPLLVASNVGWTDAHRQNGKAKIYLWMRWNQNVFARGVPKITAVVKGRKVYDPRSGLTAWSDNWALCISDWLTNDQVGIGVDYAAEMDEPQLIAAANTCDEAVALAAGGTEKRYTMNGAMQVGGSARDTLGRLNTAANGIVRFIGGKWKIYPAVYSSPSITLTNDDLRGSLHVMPRVSKRDLCNQVKGLYSGPDNLWQPTDFPPVTNATYLAEDQGEELWRELDLQFTNSTSMAQRIAKIELERVRQQILVEWPGKLGCYRLQPGNTVMVTLTRYGWSSKVFEVVSTKLAFEQADDGMTVGCDLVLRETASAVYDWNSGEETAVDPAPDTNLPDAFNVSAPGVPVITEALYETRDGRGVAAKAIMAWGAAADAFVRAYQPEFRAVGATAYSVLPRTEGLTADVLDVAAGRYDFRVKAINQLGVSSDYATTLNAEIIGLGDIPADPVIRGFQAGGDGITGILTLEPHPALDVRRGGRWRIRHTEGDTPDPVTAWAFSVSIGDAEGYSGDQTIIQLPLKNGSYLVKAEDAVGTQSTGFVFIVVKQASVHLFTLTNTVTEDPSFTGTKVAVVAVDSLLKLEGAGLVDDIPDWDSISSLDNYGGVDAAGTYTFANRFNFGAVSRRRITTEIQGQTVNVNDLIDDRLDNIDDWLDFDGSLGGGSTDAWVEMRETDTDPAGAPVWSVWKRLDTAAVEAWAVELRLQIISSDAAYNMHINTLRATAESV
jgi:hypothetical protein